MGNCFSLDCGSNLSRSSRRVGERRLPPGQGATTTPGFGRFCYFYCHK